MNVIGLRYAASRFGRRQKLISLNQSNLFKVVGENPSGKQARQATSQNNGMLSSFDIQFLIPFFALRERSGNSQMALKLLIPGMGPYQRLPSSRARA